MVSTRPSSTPRPGLGPVRGLLGRRIVRAGLAAGFALLTVIGVSPIVNSAAVLVNSAAPAPSTLRTTFANLEGASTQVPYAIPGLAAGQVTTRPLTMRNPNAGLLRYSVTSLSAESTVAGALRTTVKSGVADCSDAGFAASGTVIYGPGVLGTPSGTPWWGNPQAGPDAGDRLLPAGAAETLCLQTVMPAGSSTGLNTPTTTSLRIDSEVNNGNYATTVRSFNPLFYYRLNDTGTTATDLISAANGTYAGTYNQGQAPGQVGDATARSVTFSGNSGSGHIALPATAANTFDNGLSVAAWVYPTANSRWSRIVEFSNGREADNLFFTRYDANEGLHYGTRGPANGSSGAATTVGANLLTDRGVLPLNTWTHVALSVSATGNPSIFVNGILVASGGTNFDIQSVVRTQNYLARSVYPVGQDDYFQGGISEVAVFNRGLSAADIRTIYDSRDLTTNTGSYTNMLRSTAPVQWYRLNHTAGSTARDFAASRHGTVFGGATTSSATPLTGDTAARSLTLDGVDDYVALPYAPAFQFTNGMTVSAWVRPTNNGHWGRIADFSAGGAENYNIIFSRTASTNGLHFSTRSYNNGAAAPILTTMDTPDGVMPLNTWTLVTLTVAADGKPTIYINGAASTTTSTYQDLPDVARTQVWIGRSPWGGDGYFGGQIADYAIWNRALSAGEVANLYAAR